MARFFVLLLVLLLALTFVDAGKKKKNKKGKKTIDCDGTIAEFEACLANGYEVDGCASGDGSLSKKQAKACKKAAKAVKKCDYTCDPPARVTTAAPTTQRPTTQPPTTQRPTTEPTLFFPQCVFDNIDFPGADIRDVMADDIDNCVEICEEEPGCESITFKSNTEDNNCLLKNRRGGNGPSVLADHQSLNMGCDGQPVDTGCRRTDMDNWGADIVSLDSNGFDDCANLCKATEGCESISFDRSSNHCWLKNKRGGANGPVPASGLDCMNIDCTLANSFDWSDESCLLQNFDFWGADEGLRTFDSTGYQQCREACRDAPECRSITMNNDNHCWLKSKQGGANGPKQADGLRSTNLECPTEAVDTSCRQDNTDYWGADLWDFDVDNLDTLPYSDYLERCAYLCTQGEACVSLMYYNGHCWLKNAQGGERTENSDGRTGLNVPCISS